MRTSEHIISFSGEIKVGDADDDDDVACSPSS